MPLIPDSNPLHARSPQAVTLSIRAGGSLVALLRRPTVPLVALGLAAAVAPEHTRALMTVAGRSGAFFMRRSLEYLATLRDGVGAEAPLSLQPPSEHLLKHPQVLLSEDAGLQEAQVGSVQQPMVIGQATKTSRRRPQQTAVGVVKHTK